MCSSLNRIDCDSTVKGDGDWPGVAVINQYLLCLVERAMTQQSCWAKALNAVS